MSRIFFARAAGAAALASALLWSPAAGALSIEFDVPATGTPAVAPPYPSVGTLTLTQTGDGVQFTLDPNEASPGFGSNSFVQRIDIAYGGAALSAADFQSDSGVPGDFEYEDNPNNFDAGYQAADAHIIVDFPSAMQDRFTPDQVSVWTVLGTTLEDFTGSLASANNKPNPIYAVLSLTGYSLESRQPTPSNWVAVVPEPGTAGLILLGLGGLARYGRLRRS